MMFAKRLRDGVREGRITCSVRIWTRPHVRVGGVYRRSFRAGTEKFLPELARGGGQAAPGSG